MRSEKEIDKLINFLESPEYTEHLDEQWYSEAFAGILKWVKGEEMSWLVLDENDAKRFTEEVKN